MNRKELRNTTRQRELLSQSRGDIHPGKRYTTLQKRAHYEAAAKRKESRRCGVQARDAGQGKEGEAGEQHKLNLHGRE